MTKNKKTKSQNWFDPGKKLNWTKNLGQTARRNNALEARKGNYLKAARALMALSNVTQDEETHNKARADALYFFMKHNKQQQKQGNKQ